MHRENKGGEVIITEKLTRVVALASVLPGHDDERVDAIQIRAMHDTYTSAPAMARALLALMPALERYQKASDEFDPLGQRPEAWTACEAHFGLIAAFEVAKRELEAMG
jgi:hypothetical protein